MRLSFIDQKRDMKLDETLTECSFIDPDGGPFLSSGYELEPGVEITKIEVSKTQTVFTVKTCK